MTNKTIAIIGTLNTKECEGYYLKERIEDLGLKTILIDVSLRKYDPKLGKPDISNEKIAESIGTTLEKISFMDRIDAIKKISKGGSKIIEGLYNKGQIQGIIGFGGGVGLVISSNIFKNLPLLIPKLIVSPVAHNARLLLEVELLRDIVLMPSLTDMTGGDKVNRIEAEVLAKAAAAIAGMVESKHKIVEDKPLILASQFGVTTPHILKANEILSKIGYEMLSFAASGVGGQILEDLVRSGRAVAVLDVTTHELADELCGGVLSAGPNRMEAAGEKGIPQIIFPGALDMVNFFEPHTVPKKYKNRYFYHHIPKKAALMRLNEQESSKLGEIFAKKINKSKGPTVIAIPVKGWSQYDREDGPYCVDYDGKKTRKKWYNPDSDMIFVKILEKHLDKSKSNIEVLKFPFHINDPKLVEITTTILDDMITGKWKKGKKYP